MTEPFLHVLLNGVAIGVVVQGKGGRLRFAYDNGWREARESYPLSLSLPLVRAEHGHEPVAAYLWGLLPDNERVLARWARQFHVSPGNPFALLSHVGEDCAGAVQFVVDERLADVTQAAPTMPTVKWLDEAGIAERLRALRTDHTAWRFERDTGQFSLAGAQPKTALLFHQGRWGVPSGRTPTTHILKPPTGTFEGHAENEHLCLELARALGLPAARSRVVRFDDEVAIVVERYDRLAAPATGRRRTAVDVQRLHQEDVCQALGILAHHKYVNEGGPGIETIVTLLRSHSSDVANDVRTFVDAITFNWLIGGTDAHAKNFSLLHGAGNRVRLAPLYDLASALPYPSLDPRRLKLAMKLGGTYRMRDVAARHFEGLARSLRLDPEEELGRVVTLSHQLEAAVPAIVQTAEHAGLEQTLMNQLANLLVLRAKNCRETLLVTSKAAARSTEAVYTFVGVQAQGAQFVAILRGGDGREVHLDPWTPTAQPIASGDQVRIVNATELQVLRPKSG